MVKDEINVMRSSIEEDNEPCNWMHASVRTESAVLIEEVIRPISRTNGFGLYNQGGGCRKKYFKKAR